MGVRPSFHPLLFLQRVRAGSSGHSPCAGEPTLVLKLGGGIRPCVPLSLLVSKYCKVLYHSGALVFTVLGTQVCLSLN